MSRLLVLWLLWTVGSVAGTLSGQSLGHFLGYYVGGVVFYIIASCFLLFVGQPLVQSGGRDPTGILLFGSLIGFISFGLTGFLAGFAQQLAYGLFQRFSDEARSGPHLRWYWSPLTGLGAATGSVVGYLFSGPMAEPATSVPFLTYFFALYSFKLVPVGAALGVGIAQAVMLQHQPGVAWWIPATAGPAIVFTLILVPSTLFAPADPFVAGYGPSALIVAVASSLHVLLLYRFCTNVKSAAQPLPT